MRSEKMGPVSYYSRRSSSPAAPRSRRRLRPRIPKAARCKPRRRIAPTGDDRFKTMEFALLFGSRDAVASWSFAIVDQKKNPIKTMKGDAAGMPETLTWDGKSDSGAVAPEGSYAAVLSIDYGAKFKTGFYASKTLRPGHRSSERILHAEPGPIRLFARWKTSAHLGLPRLQAGDRQDRELDPGDFDAFGNQAKSFDGAPTTAKVQWDGKMESGSLVETAKSYPAVLTISDEYGNKGTFKGAFAVADVPGAQPSTIAARRQGFSPTSASVKNTLDLLVSVGSKTSAQSWRVEVESVANGAVRRSGRSPAKRRMFPTSSAGMARTIRATSRRKVRTMRRWRRFREGL